MKKLKDTKEVEMVLSSFQDGVVITKHCKKYGVSRSTFYRCKNRVIGAILTTKAYEKRPKRSSAPAKSIVKKQYRCRIK